MPGALESGISAEVSTSKPAGPSKSTADYHAEAMKLLADTPEVIQKTETPAPPEGEGVPEPLPEGAKADEPEQKPEEEKKPEEKKPEESKARGFDALVREKAALRKKEQEVERKLADKRELLDAVERGDALAIIRAAGITHEQYTKQMLGIEQPRKGAAAKQPDADSPVLAEVKKLAERLEQQERRAQEAEFEAVTLRVAKEHADKFPLISHMGYERQAQAYLRQYISDTGEMPGATIEESLRISMEALEANLEQQAKAWEGVLTKVRKAGTVPGTIPAKEPSKPAVQPSAASGQAPSHRTLTSALAAPGKPPRADAPKSDEDYRREALALLNGLGST